MPDDYNPAKCKDAWILIEKGATTDRFRSLAKALGLTTEVRGKDLAVSGPKLDRFLEKIDSKTWDPKNAKGDA